MLGWVLTRRLWELVILGLESVSGQVGDQEVLAIMFPHGWRQCQDLVSLAEEAWGS